MEWVLSKTGDGNREQKKLPGHGAGQRQHFSEGSSHHATALGRLENTEANL
jgi:hypothetical protein